MNNTSVERRLAAILAADIVGYSRLMGADESGTRARFNRLQETVIIPTVARHRGRIVKVAGDGFLVEFSSVVDAVSCAIDWQDGMAAAQQDDPEDTRLWFRIGINLGDIIVEGDDIHGDGVNTAARLEAQAEPGGIALSLSARDQVRDKLPITLIDRGEVEVKNIVRPIRLFVIARDGQPAPKAVARTAPNPFGGRKLLALLSGAAIIVAIAIGATLVLQTRRDTGTVSAMALPLPDNPSVAILPFRSPPGEQAEWIADSIVQDVTSALSQVSGLFVISSSSAFNYRGAAINPREVAQDLGVRNIVQGSVRGGDGDLLVSVEMTDGISGSTIWRQDFDTGSGSTFALKEDITQSIARELAISVSRSSARARPTENEEAYLFWYRASREINKAPSFESYEHARVLSESALALDPEFGRAKAVLAYIETQNGYFGFVEDRAGALNRGAALAEEAIRLAPDDWYVHEMNGFALMNLRRYEASVEAFEYAIRLAPASESTLVRSALPLLFLGRAQEAERRLLTAMRINPIYNWAAPNFLAMAYYEQERYDEAAERFDEAAKLNPGFIGNMVWRAAAHAQIGNDETARQVAAELMAAAPNWTISTNFVQIKDAAVMERLNDGLRKAGLPE